MRELTFKGYLQQQLCELSDCNSKSLYKFARLAESNARLKNVLCLYLANFVPENLKNQLCKRFPYVAIECERLSEFYKRNEFLHIKFKRWKKYFI